MTSGTIAAESDAAVVRRSLTEPTAFATIFDRYWPRLHTFCSARAGAAGEDIAAETFRIAFDDRRRFDGRSGDLRPWLFGIATNLLRHHFRSIERGRHATLRVHSPAARYASVLADDPGSAVMTLTSLGMVHRSRPRDREDPG